MRGFLAGVVRHTIAPPPPQPRGGTTALAGIYKAIRAPSKKLGLTVQSDKTDGERVYRVIEPQAA